MKNNLRAWSIALVACVPLLAAAQAAKTEPPQATPPLTYRSAFADYKPYNDVALANWRELNNTVADAPGGASGHAGHSMGGMKGMATPNSPAAPASAAMPTKPMPMHDGHPKKGGKP